MTTELTSEIVARQTGDSNLQTQIDSVVERVDDAAFIGDRMGSETLNPSFDPETDTVWNKPQVLSAAQKTQVKQNLGIDTELQLLHNQYTALTQSNVVIGPLPAAGSGQTNTIYRVPGTNSYSDYMYATQGGTEILMATYNNGVDTVPTPNSTNIIESNAVAVHGNALDISELNKSESTLATYTSLSEALATVPASVQRGGMSIKFIQLTPASYSVVKTEGVTEQPTGTEVQEALTVGTGSYTAEQLSGITLPTNVGGSVTYWLAVTVDEVTTYTTWVITYASAESQEYVQHFLTNDEWNTNEVYWQKLNIEKEVRILDQKIIGVNTSVTVVADSNIWTSMQLPIVLLKGVEYELIFAKTRNRSGNTVSTSKSPSVADRVDIAFVTLDYFAQNLTKCKLTPTSNTNYLLFYNLGNGNEVSVTIIHNGLFGELSDSVGELSDSVGELSDSVGELSDSVGEWKSWEDSPIGNFVQGSLDQELKYQETNRRLIGTLDLSSHTGKKLLFGVQSGDYEFSVRMMSSDYVSSPESVQLSSSDIVQQVGWLTGGELYITQEIKSAVIIIKHNNNAIITTSDAANLFTKIGIGTITESVNDLIDKVYIAASGY